MNKTILTRAAVAEALDQLIIERGDDYVYPQAEAGGCFYSFEDGKPGCIVGAIVAKLDPVAYEELVLAEPAQDDGNGGIKREPCGSSNSITSQGIVLLDPEDYSLRRALREAQSTQDTGDNWGRAREAFIRELHRRDGIVAAGDRETVSA